MSTYSNFDTPQNLSIISLSIDQIEPNPFQPRTYFDDEKLDDLADSIRNHGVTSPLLVRPYPERPEKYQLVYGERRLRAAKIAGLKNIPCQIQTLTDDDLIEIGLTENLQREGLTPLEEAHIFESLRGQNAAYSLRRLGQRIGKDKSYIEDRLALLKLQDDLINLITEKPNVSLRAVREVAKLRDPHLRAPFIQHLQEDEITTQQVIQQVKSLLSTSTSTPSQIEIQGGLKKLSSRIDSSVREAQKVEAAYLALDPSYRNKEQLIEELQPLRELIQSFEELP